MLHVRRGEDAPAEFQPVDHVTAVGLGRQIVRKHCWRIGRIGRLQPDLAAAFGAKLIDDQPKPDQGCSPSCGLSELNGEIGYLHVRRRKFRRACARTAPPGRRPWSAARNGTGQVPQPDLELLHVALHHVVQRDRRGTELDRRRIVILQALADARQVMHPRDAVLERDVSPVRRRTAAGAAAN